MGPSTKTAASGQTPAAEKRRRRLRLGKRVLRGIEQFQGRHSTVGTPPVFERDVFPWVERLESATPRIRGELDHVLEHPERIPAFHQLSPDQSRISKGDQWKTFAFYVFGRRIDENCELCPETAAVLDGLPKLQNAWFSILAPRYHIPPHKGPTRAIIRVHLPLIVPADAGNCWIRIDDEIRHWDTGKCLVFDDTYEHEVRNDTDERRVVLFLDFERPMDRVGAAVNTLLLALIRRSAYVRDPMENLRQWNRKQPEP